MPNDGPIDHANTTEAPVAHPVAAKPDRQAGLKLLIELTPLAVWLVVFKFVGLIPATAVLVVATLLSVIAAWLVLGKVSPMLVITTVLVVIFGGLTVVLQNPHFIKVKPTVVNLLFSGGLAYGLSTGRNYLEMMLGEAIHLTAEGWRRLTIRWIFFFIAQAALNEVVWRMTDTPDREYLWGYFKFPGMFLLTLAFTLANLPFVKKHTPADTLAER